MSHPTWVRGLKLKGRLTLSRGSLVAPHVGAWIEIQRRWAICPQPWRSHPTWVRGLKFSRVRSRGRDLRVAPHVGAWIEISPKARPPQPCQSHPTWVRGLKSFQASVCNVCAVSHPTWVRGLKFPALWYLPFEFGRTPRGCVD